MKHLPWILVVIIIAIGGVVFLMQQGGGLGSTQNGTSTPVVLENMEKITLTTDDGVTVVGNYWAGSRSEAVLLAHMMPAAKESWDELAGKLNRAGYHVLAIDLRGHGESTTQDGGSIDFNDFSDAEHQASIKDLEAAAGWLAERGISVENLLLGGASIGANLALQYQADHPEIRASFLLSPGTNYHGVVTEPLMGQLTAGQRVYLAAALDDPQAAGSVEKLVELGQSQRTEQIFEEGGHGTDLFSERQEFMDELVVWLGQ